MINVEIKDFIVKVIKGIVIVVISSLIGLLALVLVYCIPTDKICSHVLESESTLRAQNDLGQTVIDYSCWVDSGTNIIMLNESIYPTKGEALRTALFNTTAVYSWNQGVDGWIDSLINLSNTGDFDSVEQNSYPRYWHGYLLYLKPLLYFFNLEEIYQFNFILIVGSILIIWFYMYKKIEKYSFAYLLMLATMNVGNICQSLQLSTAFYTIQLTLLLLVLQRKEKLHKNAWWIFLVDGIVLSYIDFLTYPMLAFSVPIVVYSLQLKGELSVKGSIFELIKNGAFFVLGYGGMWFMKWIYATLLTEENVIMDGIENINHRVGGDAMSNVDLFEPTRSMSFMYNIKGFLNNVNVSIIVILIICFVIFLLLKRKVYFDKVVVLNSLIGVFLPISWLMVVYNHCAQHPHLEWRLFCGVFFSVSIIAISILDVKEMSGKGIGKE